MPKSIQQPLPPMEVTKETPMSSARVNHTPEEPLRPKSTGQDLASRHAAELFDAALIAADLSTAEVAYILTLSESLVRRMRSKDARERISFAQMLRLPPSFHLAMYRLMSQRYGYGKAALLDLLEAMGRVAMELG